MRNFSLPANAVDYILLQRTDLAKWSPYKLIEILRKKVVSYYYTREMLKEYNSIKTFLPESAGKILDIGCGVAGIEILLSRHYEYYRPHLYLIDKTKKSRLYYGYEKKGAFYNSLKITRKFLVCNGIKFDRIHLISADEISFPKGTYFDLIISLVSWGFHYPVETYLSMAFELLSPTGALILDIRQGTGGEMILMKKFKCLEVITNRGKYTRVLARK